MLGTFVFVGAIIGTAIFGMVANNKGRKVACVCAYVTGSTGVLLLSVAPSYWTALPCMVVAGFVLPYNNFCSVLLNEIGDGEFRNLATGMILVAQGIMELVFVAVGYKIQYWRHLLLAAGVPMFLSCLLLFYVKESPLFLLTKRRFKEFQEVLKIIAKRNNHQFEDDFKD